MIELKKRIEECLNNPSISKSLQDIVNRYFFGNQRIVFLEQIKLIRDGKFFVGDLIEYMVDFFGYTLDRAILINQMLYDKVFQDVYLDLIDLYQINENFVADKKKVLDNENQKDNDELDQNHLIQKYQAFEMSSLMQNILASEDGWLEKLKNAGETAEKIFVEIKEDFYSAINGADKIKAVGILRALGGVGKLGVSFKDDKRYIDFWGGVLERHYGEEIRKDFIARPLEKKYFIEFLRFILEKRLGFNLEESAMIGVGLSTLCGQAGENDLAELAYGDEESGRFVWSE